MGVAELLFAIVVGVLAALAAGALSGIRVGGEAIGTELAAYMGGLYGVLSGIVAILIGVAVVFLI